MAGLWGDMEGAVGTTQAPMAQHKLHPPQLDAGFQSVRGEGMTQHRRVVAFERWAACPACRQMR
jgi:hypothetical protein